MKKIVFLILCLALACFGLVGCANNNTPFVQKEYTADIAQIKEISIDVRDRQIDVSITGDKQIHIIYFENSKESYDISVSNEHLLTMTSTSQKDWTDYIGTKPSAENRKIILQIPNALLNSITLSTTNEDINLPSLDILENVRIASNGGNITFENLGVGKALDLNVKNGDISGTVLGSYDDFSIQTEIKKGDCNLPNEKDGGEKTLNVSCNNGDVQIEFV